MKKSILAVALVLGMSQVAVAAVSRSSVIVMGQGDAGLFLPQDTSFTFDNGRNMFYNPSYINDNKDFGIIEKSNFPGGTGEGGMVKSMGMFNFGIYLNRGDELAGPALLAVPGGLGALTYSSAANMHPIDLMIGSDMGSMKWGFGLNYANFTPGGGHSSNNSLMARAGIQMMGIEPFAWFRILDTQKVTVGAGNTFADVDQTLPSMGFGVRYKMNDCVGFAGIEQSKFHDNGAGQDLYQQSAWIVGVAHNRKLGDDARMNGSIAVVHSMGSGLAAQSDVGTVIPINIAVEDDATSWLTVRAGLGFNWWDQGAGGTTIADNTTARLGASIHMGKADFDFAVGRAQTGFGTNEGDTTETAGQSLKDSQAFDISAGFFTAAAVSYHW